jgi:hypothetical protein
MNAPELSINIILQFCLEIVNLAPGQTVVEFRNKDLYLRYSLTTGNFFALNTKEGTTYMFCIDDLPKESQHAVGAALLNHMDDCCPGLYPVMQMHDGHLHPTVGRA